MVFLIVEDNLPNMYYAQFLVKKSGEYYISAFTGEEALALLKTQKVDCMLIDINLGPGISGDEFLKIIRKNQFFKKVPAIAVTAYSTDEDKERFLAEGFDDIITKPYSFNDFKQTIERNIMKIKRWKAWPCT